MSESSDVAVTSTAPTDSNTTILWSSDTRLGKGCMRMHNISRIQFTVENSHSGTLKAYRSTNGGTTWDQVGDDLAVAAAGATDVSGPYSYLVDPFNDWRLSWVNGGTTQTTWRPSLTIICGDRSAGT